ncbi:MAG: ATP-binding protein [Nostocaceae cyanobacterium]|nr:ATP-binding protein [Nostocaceae cyanobacterium]
MKHINNILRKIDPLSLRFRLTIGIAAFSAVGLGGLAIWTSWKMQHILIDSHKQSIEQLASTLPRDVQVYSEMLPLQKSLEKAVSSLSNTNTLLWVTSTKKKILVKSNSFNATDNSIASKLFSLTEMPLKPKVSKIDKRYYIVCSDSLEIKGKKIGELSIAHDITREQTMFVAMVQNLTIASILVIVAISGTIAFYIKRSLQPLRELSQMTEVISAQDLGKAHLYLENAPSEVKELAQTCNMMLSRLSQSWEQERQFVSNVSHELRTPLTIVNGYLQSVLRRQQNLTETQKEALETASLEAERTIRLLQDLLDLARADSGYLHFTIKPFVLNNLVQEVLKMADKYTERKIYIEGGNKPIKIKADYNRLQQVLLNLIDNAVKYSPAHTPIIIKLNHLQEQAIIQICDQGEGIPLQHQSRIFERFYRVDESRSNATGGTGLGLSIVKTLVDGMGGSVGVCSKLGEGSVFSVTLPLYK